MIYFTEIYNSLFDVIYTLFKYKCYQQAFYIHHINRVMRMNGLKSKGTRTMTPYAHGKDDQSGFLSLRIVSSILFTHFSFVSMIILPVTCFCMLFLLYRLQRLYHRDFPQLTIHHQVHNDCEYHRNRHRIQEGKLFNISAKHHRIQLCQRHDQ